MTKDFRFSIGDLRLAVQSAINNWSSVGGQWSAVAQRRIIVC
ncbi:MAG: hypothetical protein N2559_14055 [Anaerolineae bacterium]|nr:hypothetical protein [Anaerolineae bacterium]